jgi:hypothetical protein
MSFSANLSAYSDMPSFLRQSAICCIAATKVGQLRATSLFYTLWAMVPPVPILRADGL